MSVAMNRILGYVPIFPEKLSMALSLCIVGWLMPILPVQAASFDCGKAKTEIEKLICNNADLSKRDKILAAWYKGALRDEQQAETIRQTQKQWLKERNDCPDIACLRRMYAQREEILQPLAFATAKPQFFGPPPPNLSGQKTFKLEKETGWSVCQDYVKSLEMLQPSKEALACETNLAPNMPQFSLPDWQELNIEEHWDIVYAIEANLKLDHIEELPPIETWRNNFRLRIQMGEIKPRLRQARLRISTDEHEQTFFGYTRNRDNIQTCKKEMIPGWNPYTGEIFYTQAPNNRLAQILSDRVEDFMGDSESQAILHNQVVFLTYRDQGGEFTLIFRLYYPAPALTKAHNFAQKICQINAQPVSTTQP